jgi:hypothetical protein
MASSTPPRDGDASPLTALDARTLAFIDAIACRVRDAIARGDLPTIDLLVRSVTIQTRAILPLVSATNRGP